jgi:hypothetical protein
VYDCGEGMHRKEGARMGERGACTGEKQRAQVRRRRTQVMEGCNARKGSAQTKGRACLEC